MPKQHVLSDLRAVFFDVDGTLVDSIEMCVLGLGDTYERFVGFRPNDAEIKSMIGIPLYRQLARYDEVEPTREEMERRIAFTIERYAVHESRQREFFPAVQALEWCHHQGFKTALVTSKNAEELERFLNHFSWTNLVDTTVCASDVRFPKPHPESLRLACERLDLSPPEVAMVGDSVYDLRCARDAGAYAIGVAYGAASYEVLKAEEPDHVLNTPEALLEWVQSQQLAKSCVERT
ncbi:MAG: HAD family hydrolase [Fimbriimonas sp.]